MRFTHWLIQVSLTLFTVALPINAQQMDVNDIDRAAIRSVIQRQLQAFQADDAAAAFEFASPEIREKFGTAENFLRMVKLAYVAVYRPRSVMFENLVTVKGIPTQEVFLLGPDGNLVKALYLMELQPNGTWKISGCFLVPAAGETI